MTRKDYIAIAAAFKNRMDTMQHIQNFVTRKTHYKELATDIADAMARDNQRFNREKFIKACGFTE